MLNIECILDIWLYHHLYVNGFYWLVCTFKYTVWSNFLNIISLFHLKHCNVYAVFSFGVIYLYGDRCIIQWGALWVRPRLWFHEDITTDTSWSYHNFRDRGWIVGVWIYHALGGWVRLQGGFPPRVRAVIPLGGITIKVTIGGVTYNRNVPQKSTGVLLLEEYWDNYHNTVGDLPPPPPFLTAQTQDRKSVV